MPRVHMIVGAACCALSAHAVHAQDFFVSGPHGELLRAQLDSSDVTVVGDSGLSTTRCLAFDNKARLYSIGSFDGVVSRIDTDTAQASPFVNVSDDLGGMTNFIHAVGRAHEPGVLLATYTAVSSPPLESGIARYDEDTGEFLGHIVLDFLEGDTAQVRALVARDDGMLVGLVYPLMLAEIDLDTGAVELITVVNPSGTPAGLAVHRGVAYVGINHGCCDRLEIREIDLYTGEQSSLGQWQFDHTIHGFEVVPENPADCATPFGFLDISDAIDFLGAFAARDEAADLALPTGAFDYLDVYAFIDAFARGYP